MSLRRRYRTKNGIFRRGTWVKPKHYSKKLVVDLDFHTKTRIGKDGKLRGRSGIKKIGEKVPVIRTRMNGGIIVGRAKKMSAPYPRTYPIFARINNKTRRKNIPVGDY